MKFNLVKAGVFVFVLINLLFIPIIVLISSEFRYAYLIDLLLLLFIFIFIDVISIVIYFIVIKRKTAISESLNFYAENVISKFGLGMLCYDENLIIIWTSEMLDKRFGFLSGKYLKAISSGFFENFSNGTKSFKFYHNQIIYSINVDMNKKIIVFKDVTNEDMIIERYNDERLVFGELEIDNFQQFQVMLFEEDMFEVKSNVIDLLDDMVEKYNIIYREYASGKYFLTINQSELEKLILSKFQILDSLKDKIVINNIKLTVSMGFGAESSTHKTLVDLAKEALLQAQSRGGDQVCISYLNRHPQYFGAHSELVTSVSKVKINKVSEIFEQKLLDSNIKNVIIYGHIRADLDAVGAALGVLTIAMFFKKNTYIQNATFDNTTNNAIKKYLPKELKEKFIKPSKANKITDKNTLVVIVDTSNIKQIENPKAFTNAKTDNIFIFDHHRIVTLPEKIPSLNTYIDSTASSTCEIISEVFKFIEAKVIPSRDVAQFLLNGIYLDTIQFKKSTSSRTFEAATYLTSFGASAKIANNILKPTEKTSILMNNIQRNLIEVKPGHFLAVTEQEAPIDTVSYIADEVLKTQGRLASYIVAKVPGKKKYKLSARSTDINVQTIVEKVGGGGHYAAAAAMSSEPLHIFKENIIQAIIDSQEKVT